MTNSKASDSRARHLQNGHLSCRNGRRKGFDCRFPINHIQEFAIKCNRAVRGNQNTKGVQMRECKRTYSARDRVSDPSDGAITPIPPPLASIYALKNETSLNAHSLRRFWHLKSLFSKCLHGKSKSPISAQTS